MAVRTDSHLDCRRANADVPTRARVCTLVDCAVITFIETDRAGRPGEGPGVTGLIGSAGAGGRSGPGRSRGKPGRRADRPPSGRGRAHQSLERRRAGTNASTRQIPQATCKTHRITATMGRKWTPCPTGSPEKPPPVLQDRKPRRTRSGSSQGYNQPKSADFRHNHASSESRRHMGREVVAKSTRTETARVSAGRGNRLEINPHAAGQVQNHDLSEP